jgi:hypothetical protein
VDSTHFADCPPYYSCSLPPSNSQNMHLRSKMAPFILRITAPMVSYLREVRQTSRSHTLEEGDARSQR